MIQHQPKEMVKYVISADYVIFDKMMDHLDDKSVCELFVKLLNEISDHNCQSLPGIPDVQAVL